MLASEFLSSFMESGVGKGIAASAGAIASVATIYKFFIEFVEANEQAVRSRNNKPDYLHQPMTSWRKLAVFGPLVLIVAVSVIGMTTTLINGWIIFGLITASVVEPIVAIETWPRTDQVAWVGPGLKLKVPGYISYKRGDVAVLTRHVVLSGIKDGSHELVNVDVVYRTWRIRDNPERLWHSLARVVGLEEGRDEVVLVAAQEQVNKVSDARALTPEGVEALVQGIQRACEGTFRDDYGSEIEVVGIARHAEPEQVKGMRVVAEALQGAKGIDAARAAAIIASTEP